MHKNMIVYARLRTINAIEDSSFKPNANRISIAVETIRDILSIGNMPTKLIRSPRAKDVNEMLDIIEYRMPI